MGKQKPRGETPEITEEVGILALSRLRIFLVNIDASYILNQVGY